jgi:DNA primase
MIKGVKRERLTVDKILSKISEYDIFRFYMPYSDWKLGTACLSPFRRERTPSFLIGVRGDSINFIDFGDTSKRGNCFEFVQQLYNIPTFFEVLLKIDNDFGLGISSGTPSDQYKTIIEKYEKPQIVEKEYSFIQVKTRNFTNEELAYWNEYYQDVEDLKSNNVFSIAEVYLNKKRIVLSDNELRFGYLYDGNWKIYRPFNKRWKWVPNNVPITAMDGKNDIRNCNVAFINKSKKDYMVMKKIYDCCCAVQNEGMGCFSDENVQFLKDNSNRQILSFDSDKTGVENSKKITEMFGFEYCNVPRNYLSEGIKDWADLAKVHGLKVIEDYLINKNIIQ